METLPRRIFNREFTINSPSPVKVTLQRTIAAGKTGWCIHPVILNGKKTPAVMLRKLGKKWFARLPMALEPIADGKTMSEAWLKAVNGITKPDGGSVGSLCWDYLTQAFSVRLHGKDIYSSESFESAYNYLCETRTRIKKLRLEAEA